MLFIDVLEGMMIGLLASLAFVIYRSSRPHLSSLGRVPGTPGAYSDLARHPENSPVPGVLIVRLDAPMYYANALTARDQVKDLLAQADPPPTALVLDMRVQSGLDLTAADMLTALLRDLQDRGIEVRLADVHAPVLDLMRTQGLFESSTSATSCTWTKPSRTSRRRNGQAPDHDTGDALLRPGPGRRAMRLGSDPRQATALVEGDVHRDRRGQGHGPFDGAGRRTGRGW